VIPPFTKRFLGGRSFSSDVVLLGKWALAPEESPCASSTATKPCSRGPSRIPRKPLATGILATAALLCTIVSGCSLQSTPAEAKDPAAPALQFVNAWGVKGSDPGQLDEPASIATDARGNVYIADAGSLFIHKFQPGGTPLLSFQDDRLKHPQSIAVDRGGAIYVTDPMRGSVFIFLPDGSRYREIRLQTRPNLENILDVTVADDGSMSILDVNAAKVFDFNPRLRFQRSWIPNVGAPSRPREIEAGPADAIYVTGATNSILRYDDGKLTSQITLAPQQAPNADNSAPPSFPPAQNSDVKFAISASYIFESDPNGRSILVWSLDGKPKAALNLPSDQLGDQLRTAPPIAVSPAGDLLVLLPRQSKVLRFHLNL
jgi:streptogramin lyase